MYFTFACPHCEKKLKVQDDTAGRKAGCPYCKRSIIIPSPPAPEKDQGLAAFEGIGDSARTSVADRATSRQKEFDAGKTTPKKARKKKTSSAAASWSDRTDVGMLTTGLMGLGFSVVFFVLMAPFWNFYLGELFLQRGWVPFVLVFLLGWSIAILILKWRKLKRQSESVLFDLLPSELSEDITVDSLDKFVDHIHGLPVVPGESFLINRVVRGLEHFRVRKSNPEVANMLASQSDLDANAVQSSYTLLNVFIWAIPILGFIGTVIGISSAVGGFSGALEQAQDISVLKDSLNNVTGGLATAFDTTLIALVMSMLVMFPSSSLQKAEEDLLNSVDEYCNENLLKRLNDGLQGVDGAAEGSPLQQAINAAMAPHHAELRAWNEKLTVIGATLTKQVAQGWSEMNRQLESRQTENVEQIHDVDTLIAMLQRTLGELAEKTNAVHQQTAGSMAQSAESLQGYLAAVERGLTGLNRVLEKLGEKQVIVEAPRRRGWFSRK